MEIQIDENVYNKIDRPKVDTKTVRSSEEEELDLDIDFSSMQKFAECKNHGFVVQNDMDLKDLHKSFVRTKNIKFVKIKTDEHSDSDSGKSGSSSEEGNDSDFEISQGEFFLYYNVCCYFL